MMKGCIGCHRELQIESPVSGTCSCDIWHVNILFWKYDTQLDLYLNSYSTFAFLGLAGCLCKSMKTLDLKIEIVQHQM